MIGLLYGEEIMTQLFSVFFAASTANLLRCRKSINDVTPTSDTPSLGVKQHRN